MEVMRTETLDENTGIAMDRNGKSLGFVDVRTMLYFTVMLYCTVIYFNVM